MDLLDPRQFQHLRHLVIGVLQPRIHQQGLPIGQEKHQAIRLAGLDPIQGQFPRALSAAGQKQRAQQQQNTKSKPTPQHGAPPFHLETKIFSLDYSINPRVCNEKMHVYKSPAKPCA